MVCVGAVDLPALRRTGRLLGVPAAPRLHRERLRYTTTAGGEFIDITDDVAAVVERSGLREGLVHVFSLHTTAAVRSNEHEPLLLADFRALLERLAPAGGYSHDDLARRAGVGPEEPINGHAHARQLLLGASEVVPLADGRLQLGRYQRLFLIELCSARPREVSVQVVGA
jgi:secondary thiamine-phosphate synthase enzyme